jgi:hypothetical protein
MKALAFSLLLFSFGCGLASYPYLYKPEVKGFQEEVLRSFYNTPINNPNIFWGFEVFYKIHDPREITSPVDDPNVLRTEAEDFLTESNILSGTISNNGYFRLFETVSGVIPDAIIKPLVKIPEADRGNDFYITINLTDFHSPILYFPDTDETGAFAVRRKVDTGAAVFEAKGFDNDDLDPEDPDVPDSLSDPDNWDGVVVTFYVCTFGYTVDFQPIYSEPEYIGKIEI